MACLMAMRDKSLTTASAKSEKFIFPVVTKLARASSIPGKSVFNRIFSQAGKIADFILNVPKAAFKAIFQRFGRIKRHFIGLFNHIVINQSNLFFIGFIISRTGIQIFKGVSPPLVRFGHRLFIRRLQFQKFLFNVFKRLFISISVGGRFWRSGCLCLHFNLRPQFWIFKIFQLLPRRPAFLFGRFQQ